MFRFDENQLQPKLKESKSNIRTLQQQLSDIKREKEDREDTIDASIATQAKKKILKNKEATIDVSIATQAKKKIIKNKKDHGKKNSMADSTSTFSANNGNSPSSWNMEIGELCV